MEVSMYNHVVLEISGKCNARCKWCVTGNGNRTGKRSGKALTPEMLEKAVSYLRDNHIIQKDALFFLYNWGEPLLNPHFKKIIAILNRLNIRYVISTNASTVVLFDEPDILRNLHAMVISMPGFSQSSYDRIHGFNFLKIKNNITTILDNYRHSGFRGKAEIRYHVYQFNIDEIIDAIRFAKKHYLGISPTFAGIGDLDIFMSYRTNELSYDMLKDLSQDLFLYYMSVISAQIPKDYHCPYHEVLLIDENCSVLTCCMVNKRMDDYSIGNLFELSLAEMKKRKVSQSVCKKCMELAIPYLINNRPYPSMIGELDAEPSRYHGQRSLYIWGTGKMGKTLWAQLKAIGVDIEGFISSDDSEKTDRIEDKKVFSRNIMNQWQKGGDLPHIIIADEYIAPKADHLKRLGYTGNQDFSITSLIRR